MFLKDSNNFIVDKANTLTTARTINGTSFNGSANITTAQWGTARNISIADSDGTNTGSAVSVNGSANATLKLPATIKASLSGNASTSTKATQDSAGQQINTTYIKGLSVSGKTITYTKGDGSTGTITTQDTNTTYSTGTASALGLTKLYTGTGTATDGTMTQAAINTALGGKANTSHGNHVPAVETADARKFLRNDNTWQTLPTSSTSATGIVQLNNTVTSTSTSQAGTANAVKMAYDKGNEALTKANEALQSGNNVKKQLVDTLVAKSIGVSTSDSWDTLISKIDEIGGGLNIITATSLPSKGVENQICVITSSPATNFVISNNLKDLSTSSSVISLYTGDTSVTGLPIKSNGVTMYYYISQVLQGGSRLSSYCYTGGKWVQLTLKSLAVFANGAFLNTDITGGIGTYSSYVYISNSNLALVATREYAVITTTLKQIDFSSYKKLKIKAYASSTVPLYVGSYRNSYVGVKSSTFNPSSNNQTYFLVNTSETTVEIDVSSWGTGYLGFMRESTSVAPSIFIKEIELS